MHPRKNSAPVLQLLLCSSHFNSIMPMEFVVFANSPKGDHDHCDLNDVISSRLLLALLFSALLLPVCVLYLYSSLQGSSLP